MQTSRAGKAEDANKAAIEQVKSRETRSANKATIEETTKTRQ
jgi:hypothetical protein